jgi:large subunit ribosomal protein L13
VKTVQKSYIAKKETVSPEWFVIDGDGEIVGRLAVRIATVLMGKHKPGYTPHVDTGDFVIVLNCDQVRFSGKPVADKDHPHFTRKTLAKEYDYWTGYPGGRVVETAAELLDRHPERVLTEAVRRMLPKSKLGRKMLSKLKLYVGSEHPHQAQQPAPFPEYVK